MATVYLALGSNLGDREGILRSALGLLTDQVIVLAVSALYETEPIGYPAQPQFLNAVVIGETRLTPHAVLTLAKEIERQLGRRPTFVNGPRVVDIDVLSYDNEIVESPDLHVPHPRIQERAFVLVPLSEVDPNWRHPVSQITVKQLLGEVAGIEGVRLFKTDWVK